MHLDLGTTEAAHLPTDARLEAVKAGASDPGLAALYFQYGRYLMMGSSRTRMPTCESTGHLERAHERPLEQRFSYQYQPPDELLGP